MPDYIGPLPDPQAHGSDPENIGKIVSLFKNETGSTVAWKEDDLPSDSVSRALAQALEKIDLPEGEKKKMADFGLTKTEYVDLRLPAQLLEDMSKLAMMGVCVSAQMGLDIPMRTAVVDDEGNEMESEDTPKDMLMSFFANQQDAENRIKMVLLAMSWIAWESREIENAKALDSFSSEIDSFVFPDAGEES